MATEHGVADLRAKDMDARAEALIAIAAPDHRRGLTDEWQAMRRKLWLLVRAVAPDAD